MKRLAFLALLLSGCAAEAPVAKAPPPSATCARTLADLAANLSQVEGARHGAFVGLDAAALLKAFNAIPPTGAMDADRVDVWATRTHALIAFSLKGCVVGYEQGEARAILGFVERAIGGVGG